MYSGSEKTNWITSWFLFKLAVYQVKANLLAFSSGLFLSKSESIKISVFEELI
jgi:hypothetical protein